MKRIASVIIALLLITPYLIAQKPAFAFSSETLTVSNSVKTFTANKVTVGDLSADIAVLTVNCSTGTSCIMRFTLDGSTPSTSAGLRALYGDTVSITGNNSIKNFKSIRETSTDVIIDVTYFAGK